MDKIILKTLELLWHRGRCTYTSFTVSYLHLLIVLFIRFLINQNRNKGVLLLHCVVVGISVSFIVKVRERVSSGCSLCGWRSKSFILNKGRSEIKFVIVGGITETFTASVRRSQQMFTYSVFILNITHDSASHRPLDYYTVAQ